MFECAQEGGCVNVHLCCVHMCVHFRCISTALEQELRESFHKSPKQDTSHLSGIGTFEPHSTVVGDKDVAK